jgi:ABC-2 type transport system permease protein
MTDLALDLTPASGASSAIRQLIAQTRMELRLMLRNGEQLLLTILIPSVVLILFASVPIADLPKPRIDYLVPGVIALAVMSTAFTGQAIGTGFERRYGVLKRLGTTPMSRGVLIAAKTLGVLVIEALQITLLSVIARQYGWHPDNIAGGIALIVLGTAAFSGLGLLMAGTLRAEGTLAAANLVFILLLVLGGVAFPLSDFGGLSHVLRYTPTAALSDGLRVVLHPGRFEPSHGFGSSQPAFGLTMIDPTKPSAFPIRDVAILLVWSIVGIAAAARWFRWE